TISKRDWSSDVCSSDLIAEVDESLTEAARGIGMKPMRRLIKVEIPIAMPVIMAGVRTAMVLTIGTATLAALIGAGGLGDLILLRSEEHTSELQSRFDLV